ncbi:glycosyltransferase family 2 protein [Macrococcus caseolyticus]|uniref:glycosyltransferase family 2 protein n=1 Tax=Macrococcoides caseolyticum TaxID=69966 RepID=UPI0024BC060B|nr:glycosyltransferase family 2 protein [Macrococcus caseolyticus]MDJ1090131.1 glycosyltransferase family 2 protein [Macrococcus caseolyticus]
MKKTINCDVIIPTFKNINTILRAVNSIENQTVLPKKIYIIDDFSNDEKYLELLNKLNDKSLIEVILLDENVGPGSARNVGIKLSDAKYIAFLDSDDAWHPKKLEIQYYIMEKELYYLTCHRTVFKVDDEIEDINKNFYAKKIQSKKLLFKNIIATRSVMMRNDKRYYFKENKRYSEDYLMWLEIAIDNNKLGYIDENLAYHFYNNISSGLSSNQKGMFLGELENFRILNENQKISNFTKYICSCLSFIKYLNRLRKTNILIKGFNLKYEK